MCLTGFISQDSYGAERKAKMENSLSVCVCFRLNVLEWWTDLARRILFRSTDAIPSLTVPEPVPRVSTLVSLPRCETAKPAYLCHSRQYQHERLLTSSWKWPRELKLRPQI
jgi:hypothetical protein